MTNDEFRKKFWFIAPGIPVVQEGEVPMLLYDDKAYVPGPNNQCMEFPNEQAVKDKFPGGGYIAVSCGTKKKATP